jgi:hypothetical protein
MNIDDLTDHHYALLVYLKDHVILPNLSAFPVDSQVESLPVKGEKVMVLSSSTSSDVTQKERTGVLGRVMLMVASIVAA